MVNPMEDKSTTKSDIETNTWQIKDRIFKTVVLEYRGLTIKKLGISFPKNGLDDKSIELIQSNEVVQLFLKCYMDTLFVLKNKRLVDKKLDNVYKESVNVDDNLEKNHRQFWPLKVNLPKATMTGQSIFIMLRP
jgi:hypothetical protein